MLEDGLMALDRCTVETERGNAGTAGQDTLEDLGILSDAGQKNILEV